MLYSESGVGVASHHHPLVALPHRLHLDRGQPHHHQLFPFYSTVSSSTQPSCPSSFRRILHLPAGDLDAPLGGQTEMHHLGSLPLLPPPPRHHHLLHHPHLHDGPGQCGKWKFVRRKRSGNLINQFTCKREAKASCAHGQEPKEQGHR